MAGATSTRVGVVQNPPRRLTLPLPEDTWSIRERRRPGPSRIAAGSSLPPTESATPRHLEALRVSGFCFHGFPEGALRESSSPCGGVARGPHETNEPTAHQRRKTISNNTRRT
jgi:hypothetical protein